MGGMSFSECPTDRPGREKNEVGMPVEMVTCRIREDDDERGKLINSYIDQYAHTQVAPEVVKGCTLQCAQGA
jgi:hypothetical protein